MNLWDNHASTYDEYYNTFQGAVEHYVDWELLKQFLPENKNIEILDAAGGTGRITLPLAKMGYSMTLCDISPNMLELAQQKVAQEGLFDKIKICKCDIRKLHFSDESFDLVLCWDGNYDDTEGLAVKELIRVTKKGGIISIFLVNKWAAVINNFCEKPDIILSSINTIPSCLEDQEGIYLTVSPEEAINWFKKEGVKIIDIYAVCGWTKVLNIPKEILDSYNWDKEFFKKTIDMVLKLSKEPSVKGISKHLVVYGKKL
ncbi:MAG: class I SAM-dependent methyltransferase [Candidatus Odinarchaeota archaeon]